MTEKYTSFLYRSEWMSFSIVYPNMRLILLKLQKVRQSLSSCSRWYRCVHYQPHDDKETRNSSSFITNHILPRACGLQYHKSTVLKLCRIIYGEMQISVKQIEIHLCTHAISNAIIRGPGCHVYSLSSEKVQHWSVRTCSLAKSRWLCISPSKLPAESLL